MITEAVTIGVILGGSAAAAWFAKIKFQPEPRLADRSARGTGAQIYTLMKIGA